MISLYICNIVANFMKKLTLCLVFWLSVFTSYSQDKPRVPRAKLTISGIVTDDRTGEKLAGASIYLADDKMGAFADNDGRYILNNIPPGHHIVEVSHAGYATLVEHIELENDLQKDFKLTTIIVENQGVIVTGVSSGTSIRNSPFPV